MLLRFALLKCKFRKPFFSSFFRFLFIKLAADVNVIFLYFPTPSYEWNSKKIMSCEQAVGRRLNQDHSSHAARVKPFETRNWNILCVRALSANDTRACKKKPFVECKSALSHKFLTFHVRAPFKGRSERLTEADVCCTQTRRWRVILNWRLKSVSSSLREFWR